MEDDISDCLPLSEGRIVKASLNDALALSLYGTNEASFRLVGDCKNNTIHNDVAIDTATAKNSTNKNTNTNVGNNVSDYTTVVMESNTNVPNQTSTTTISTSPKLFDNFKQYVQIYISTCQKSLT